jgi:alginate O-acetyltransferase complex protein AlgJ
MQISPLVHLVAIVSFIGGIGLPLLLQPFPSSDVLFELEQREAAPQPTFPRSWAEFIKWPHAIEAYLNDRFHGRQLLVRLNNGLRYALGDSGSPKVLVGQNGWLFLNLDRINERFCGPLLFSEHQLKNWGSVWEKRAQACRAHGASLVYVIAPDKQSVYPDMMPVGFRPAVPSLTDQLIQNAGAPLSYTLLDLRSPLHETRTNSETYRQYETHWTDEGAVIAYHRIIDILQPHMPVRRILPPAYTFRPATISGDLSRMLGLPDMVENIPEIAFDSNSALVTSRPTLRDLGEMKGGWHMVSNQQGFGRALVLCDSYVGVTPLGILLANSFTETLFIAYHECASPLSAVAEFRPDVVLFVQAERYMYPFSESADNGWKTELNSTGIDFKD